MHNLTLYFWCSIRIYYFIRILAKVSTKIGMKLWLQYSLVVESNLC